MKTTDRSLLNSSNSFNTRGEQARPSSSGRGSCSPFHSAANRQKVSLNPTWRQVYTNQNKQEPYSGVHFQQLNNILTNSSESTPHSSIQFLNSRLSMLAGPGLLPIQFGGLLKNRVSYSSVWFRACQRGEPRVKENNWTVGCGLRAVCEYIVCLL